MPIMPTSGVLKKKNCGVCFHTAKNSQGILIYYCVPSSGKLVQHQRKCYTDGNDNVNSFLG